MTRAKPALCAAVAFAIVATVALFAAVGFIEDWDGGGFALACEGVDLRRFRPHPPGYPAYTAVSLSLGALGLRANECAPWLSRASALGLAVFAASLTRFASARGLRPAVTAVLATFALAGTLRVATMVSPMGIALGAWAFAVAASYAKRHSSVLSVSALAVALAARPSDGVPIVACTVAVCAARWSLARNVSLAALLAAIAHVPLIIYTGIQEYFSLAFAHAQGHGQRARTSAARFTVGSLRSLGGYAIERADWVGLCAALAVLALSALIVAALPVQRRARAVFGASVCVAWVLFAQPVEVERHWLWLAALAAFALVRALDDRRKSVRVAACALGVLGAVSGARATIDRHAALPASVQAGRFVRARGGVLFGGRATRAAEVESVVVYEAARPGEVRAIAERLPRWPNAIWVTDEIQPVSVLPTRESYTWCGPRSARNEPVCVRVSAVDLLAETRRNAR